MRRSVELRFAAAGQEDGRVGIRQQIVSQLATRISGSNTRLLGPA
jgi:hypothetical protein